MNKIYKVVWNATRGCYVVASELVKTHQGKKSTRRGGNILSCAGTALLLAIAGWGAACNFIYADVTVADQKHYGNTVTVKDIANSGKQYDIKNQQVKDGNALNKFEDFGIKQHDVANLHMEKANHQINVVKNKIDIDGVVNAIKDNKIGGDVYFFSNAGIAVGAHGVFNVGRLTLGTNTAAGGALYEGYYYVPTQSGAAPVTFDRDKEFYGKSAVERARLLNDGSLWGGNTAGDAGISFAGKINAKDSVVIAAAKSDIKAESSSLIQTGAVFNTYTAGQSADTYRNSLVNTAGIVDATAAVATTDGIALVAKKDIALAGEVMSHGRSVVIETGDNLAVTGTAAKVSRITSGGGAIALTASSSDAKLQADPGKEPGDGMISIKDAYIDSSSEKKDSGQIDITAVRNVMGVSRIDVDDATITAEGKSGHKAGDVSIHATAATKLYAWDIGDGAYALVKMGQDSRGRNTIKGDNVDISARATTSGVIGDDNELSDAEIKAGIEREKDHNAVLGLIEEYGGNFRTFGSATKTYAEANVDIDKTDIAAVGDGTGGAEHGDVKITSDAQSDIAPLNVNLIGIGFNVGIGDVKSYVDVDDSTITSAKDTTLHAEGTNAVKMSLIDFSVVPLGGVSLDFSWAQLTSDIAAKVGEKATLTSQGDVDISAKSIRSLGSGASNCGQTLGLAVGLGISDTKATADMAGTVYAKGDVSVKAENTLSENGGVYAADTVTAASIGGDTALKPTTDPILEGAGKFFSKLKKAFTEEDKTGQVAEDLDLDEEEKPAKQKKPWNKLGANASTALLFSANDATASVTGKVRGVDASGNGSDAAGAKSLTVDALTLSRSHAVVGSYQNDTTVSKDETTKKDNTITAAISYLEQRNHATAFIAGDTKTIGDTTVHAKTKIPWQTSWQSTDPVDQLLNIFFAAIDTNPVLPDLVDSWTQAAGNGDNVNGAASVTIVNYDNNAKAYIGKKDDTQTTTPKVDAAGNVNVNGETDITTVNLTGTVQSYLSYAPLNLWKTAYKNKEKKMAFEDIFNRNKWTMEDASKAGVGGAALSVHQKNNAEATIDDGAVVTAKGSADVKAEARALNIAMSAAGGPAKSVAVDATVGVNRFDNTTKARIGDAKVTAKDVSVCAEDLSKTIQAAGAIGVSGGTGIGASIAYNHINRDTEAAISGNVTADDNVDVSAKNTGEIIAASVAGAVAYDNKKPDVKNKAGSTGFHAVEDGDEDGIELDDFVNDMDDADENTPLLGHEADQHIENVANQDGAMADNVAEAKGGLAAAANVSVNRIMDTAKATVAKKEGGTAPSVTADTLRVNGLNDSAITATSAAIGANLHANAGAALAGSFMYNSITADNEAYVDGASLTLRGDTDTEEALTVRAENKEEILNIAASGSGATKGFSGAGQISLNWVDDKTDAHVKDSTVKADKAVSIEAKDEGRIDSYTGAVSVSTGSSAVGAAIGVNLIEGDTKSYLEESEVSGTAEGGKAGKLAVTADEASQITSIIASGALADKVATSFSASGNWIHTKTDAHVASGKAMKTGALTIDAGNHSNATLGVGTVEISNTAVGASVAVMVNDSDVKASLSGDAKKEKTIEADGISVKADNAYNGSAKDSESDSNAKTVAVGAALGAAKFAGSGSVTVNVISQKADASIGKGDYQAGNQGVAVEAKNRANLFGLAGGLGINLGGTGIGAAADVQTYKGHTYASIEDGAKLSKASSVKVNAESEENLTSVAATIATGDTFAGAGVAGLHVISTDTKAYIGNQDDKDVTDAGKAELVDAGDVSVTAKDTTKLTTSGGSGAVSGTAAGGLSAAVEVVNKKAAAYVGNHASVAGKSLSVQAENRSDSTTAAAGLGVGGTAGVAGAASETFVTHTTDAHVGKAARVTTSGDAAVQATSSFKQGAGAGGLGGGETAGIGLANSTVSMSADTKAHVDSGATVTGKNVRVGASHTTDITYATIAGGLAGSAAINGAVGVNVLDTKTHAYTGEAAELTATGTEDTDGITITASDETKLDGGNGGASVGFVGGGAGLALAVTNIHKDTEAYAGKAAKLDAKGQISLDAQSSEDIFNLSLQAAGGSYVGLAGATNVMNLTAITKAYTDTGAEINQKEGYGKSGSKDVSVTAGHEVTEMQNTVTAASGSGGASVGAAVDVGNIKTQTNAFLGDGNKVAAGGSVTVEAKDNMHGIMSNAISAAIGSFGLAGSISVYSVGSTMSKEDQKTLSGQASENGETVGFDSWVNEELANINKDTGKAIDAYDTKSLTEVKSSLKTTFASEAPSTAGEKGTLAKIGNGAVIDAAGDVKVHADDTLSAQNIMGSLSGSAAASAGASVSVLNTDTQTKALVDKAATVTAGKNLAISAKASHDFKEYIVGASVSGGVAGQGTVGTWTDKSTVSALLGDTNAVHAKNISITSENDRTLKEANVVGASVALVALNGAVVTANVTGSSEAGIGDDEGTYAGEVKADQALTVSSDAKTTMDANAVGAAAGIFGGTGTGADLSSAVDVLTKVGKNAKLSGKSISLTAENTPKMSALATSAGIGIGGVGVTVAEIESKDTSRVTIADGASLTAADKLIACAAMHQPADDYNAYAHAIAGSGGVINGSVAVVGIEMNHKTETAIGKNVKIQADSAEISSDHKDRGNYEIESIGAGGYSGTGADTRYTVDSTSKVTIGDGTSMTTDRETAIRADNVSEKAWMDGSEKEKEKEKENAVSGGAAYASGNGVVSVTKITHTTEANLGKVTLQASASDLTADEKAAGKTLHDKKAITIDAASRVKAHDNNALSTGSVVGAAHVKETLDVKATTSAIVAGDASLKAGETEKANAKDKSWQGKAEGDSYDGSYKGGTIAIGTRNDADLYSTTLVDVFGLAGYAGSENDVTYTGRTNTTFGAAAETAKGDISLAAGRDSAGETGTISVSAHSDILNATAIPISIQKDPYAEADSQASLTVTKSADMKSDRDILLKAKAGAVSAYGNGEVKDWVNAIEGAFGSDGSQIGQKDIVTSADVTMNGKAETGIHRKKSMTIGGENKDGTWTTTVTSDGDLSYTYGGSKPAGSELYDKLHELQQKLIDYKADPSAKAAYESEIAFLEQKMAAEGLGYFDKKGNFVETPPSSTSELDSAKAMRDQAKDHLPEIEKAYVEEITKTQNQINGLNTVATSKKAYDSAVASAADAERALTDAKSAEETAKTAVEGLAQAAGQSVDEYMQANPTKSEVTTYQQAIQDTKAKESAMTSADTLKNSAETAYTNAVTSYNSAYSDTIPTDPTQYDETDISEKQTALTKQKQKQEAAKDVRVNNYHKLDTQIQLTDDFFKNGGTEEGGKFYDKDKNEVVAVDSDGKTLSQWTEGTYYLLHRETYPQMTHDFLVGDITAQLGDIVFEGDNVSGAGTLKAGGDAEVKITNVSPNNLVTGDIHVVGSQGTAGAGQGGTIYFNSTEIKGDSAAAIQSAIQKENKDKTKSVSFAAETRYQTGGPSITIENNFRPQAYVDSDNAPYYAAPNVDLKGYIYNPRGTVTVTSANGDVYNEGTIYAGSVNMTASNGDFIQTYDASSAGKHSSISSVGGNPLDDKGGLYNVDKDGKPNDQIGSGILANGNVFISARYVNINSKIQSGVPDHAITIPKEYKLFYMDGSTRVDVTDAGQAPSGAKILASDKDGKEIEGVSYDRTNDRFVISDIEVHGGHVSIVGTILNTTNDTNKARIEALDGYGTIQVKNDSDKNIELKTLSTGGGLEGKIEITDLDRKSGKITRKTTYTRKNGVIQQSVQHYAENGKASGDPVISTFTNAKDAKYLTTKGSYYTVQTGQDSSTTTTYELHDTRVDWWGINDRTPTSAEMLANGGTVTDFSQGAVRTLEGGAFVSDYNKVDGKKDDGTYVTTDQAFQSAKPESTFTKKEERLWYTLGIAKKYDYKLVETTYDTKVTQYSLKSDYDVGIGFGGSENGGTLTVDGGSRDVFINGTLSNGRGASTLSGGSLTQGDLGYVDTGSLHMTATGNVGSASQAIKTSADTVSGSAGGDFAVSVKGNVTLGDVSAGTIAAITAEDGITQAAGKTLSASRVNLDAGSGAITGASGALAIETKQGSGEAYGLKASADGDISITNTGGDLYLDSVTSKHGDVTLTTDGSFIDNNFTDVANENAKAKLDAWAKARVLEGSETTISKQKSLLIAKVQGKYNEYQSLAAYVKDGQYTLDDTAKEALAKKGVTDIDKYIAEKQARYEELAKTVGTWEKEDVEAYVKGITDSTDKTLYGNAALTEKDLTADKYLTVEEKKEVLVGSAKSAQDLLVTYSGGSIKEGITDTQTTQKETAHVTGQNVTLTALGGKMENGKYVSGIGHKENGQKIDLSTKEKIESLTADQLIALASAERGDFKVDVDGKTVTVSSIRSIQTNADGKLTAKAENGAIYLTSDTGVKEGSNLLSGGELRVKGTGDLNNVTVGAKDQIVLESGEGEISGVTIQEGGTLTARAKKGISLAKDGDLVINTVYASDGDVVLDLKGHSLLAEDGHDTDEEMGTTYTNVEGANISIENVANVKGEGKGQSLGMKVTGTKAKDGSMVPGSIRFHAIGDADITLFGEAASDATSIEAENTAITNHGKISKGSYKAGKALHVYNAKGGTISGGTFTGADTTLTNEADLSGAKVEGTTKLTVKNAASIQNATLTGGAATVDNNGENSVMKDVTLTGSAITLTNKGTVENGTYTAETGAMTITNSGKLSSGTYTAKADAMGITNEGTIENGTFTAGGALTYDGSADSTVTETTMTGASVNITNAGTLTNDTYIAETGAMGITNEGTIKNGTFTARGDLTYTDSENASLSGSDFTSGEGNVKVTAKGQLALKKLSAKKSATVDADHDVTLTEAEAGTLAISSGGSVNAGTLTATTGDASVTAKKDVTIGTLTAEAGSATIEATEGKLDVTTLNAKEHAKLTSGGDMVLHEAEVGGKLTADAGVSILAEGKNAKISADTLEMKAGEDIRITDRSTVGKLDGVDTNTPAGSTTGSGAAGSLVMGEAKPHDFDASGKGSALLSSAGGKVTLSAKKVEIDTLKNGEGNAADLTISADNIGIDDLAGTGAQHVTIHGKDGQSQAHYAGIHSIAEGGTLVKDSKVEHLELTGREPLGLSNTAIGGDSVLATDKIRVTIQKNPGSSQAEHFGNLSLSGYDIATDHVMTSVKDGLTVNGERFPMTAESVMNASLYEDRTLGRDGREKEEETEKDSPSLAFGAPNDKEAYEVVK